MSEVVVVIPARGGSKGIPRKNLRRVGGMPLVARAISAASAATLVDRVVVSTDDPEIAAVAREWDAEVVERPAEIAGDTASSESAVLHALDAVSAQGAEVGVVVLLQATSPFIVPATLDEAVRRVADGECDAVFSAVPTFGFLWEDVDGEAVALNHDASQRPRRQDRKPHHLETGAFYALDAEGFVAAGHRFFGRLGIVEVPEHTAIEIDTRRELEHARALAPLIDVPDPVEVDAIVTDFDGVHTDDTARVDRDGLESVLVSRADGAGVALLRHAGIPLLILSAETDGVVSARAAKLGVDVRQSVTEKGAALTDWAAENGIPLHRIAYVGNDLADLPCLEAVGWPIAVPDAHPVVLAAARLVLDRPGGAGAIRELAERVLAARATRSTEGAAR